MNVWTFRDNKFPVVANPLKIVYKGIISAIIKLCLLLLKVLHMYTWNTSLLITISLNLKDKFGLIMIIIIVQYLYRA